MNAAALALLLALGTPAAEPAPTNATAADEGPLSGRTGKIIVGIATLAAGGAGAVVSAAATVLPAVVMAAIIGEHANDDGVLDYDTSITYDDDRDRFLWTEGYRWSTIVILGGIGVGTFSFLLLAIGAGVLLSALIPAE